MAEGAGTGCAGWERSRVAWLLTAPKRRTFTAAYKTRILREYDQMESGRERGALLGREGLYSSHIDGWRKARDAGAANGMTDKRPGGRDAAPRRWKTSGCANCSGNRGRRCTRQRNPEPAAEKAPPGPRAPHPAALSGAEQAALLAVLDSERFADKSPAQVYAILLDDGIYLASIRTMYRVMTLADQVRTPPFRDRAPHASLDPYDQRSLVTQAAVAAAGYKTASASSLSWPGSDPVGSKMSSSQPPAAKAAAIERAISALVTVPALK